MATLEKITLSSRELSDLGKIQDAYNLEKAALQEKLGLKLMGFWQEIRQEHSLDDLPFHVMESDIWVIKDATREEQEAFIKMTSYK